MTGEGLNPVGQSRQATEQVEAILSDIQKASEGGTMDQRQQTYLSSPDEYTPEAGNLDDPLSTFIQNVSHELRAPLTIIQGYAELLGDGSLGAVAPKQQEAVLAIANRAHTLRALVERMDIFLEVEARAAAWLPLALDEIVAEVVKGRRAAATQAGLMLEVHLEPNLPLVSGDPYHLQQAVDCLLENAIKFTPGGGWVEVQAYTEPGWVCLAVTDTGIGITEEELERISTRFYRGNRSTTHRYGGAGLGLPLAAALIQGHGGRIEAVSLPNCGSRFTIKLPTPSPATRPVEDAMASRPIPSVDDRRQTGVTVQWRPFDPFINEYRMPDMDSMTLPGPALFPDRTRVHLGQLRGIEFDLKSDARQLLNELDQTAMSNTAYDTAWIARVPSAIDSSTPAFPEALDWLRRNQYPNGSWGAKIEYYHDLIISTLAAIVALAKQRDGLQDAKAIRRGENYIQQNIQNLHRDPYDTVGFELILPTLLQEAQRLGLVLPYDRCNKYDRMREEKLRLIPSEMFYSREVTTAHSLEFMGSELDLDRAGDIQEENGSFGNSPSATAYFLAECQDDPAARRYLSEVVNIGGGMAMPLHPVEIFNQSWVLYNLDLAGLLDELREEAKVHLDSLHRAWDPQRGLGFSHQYSVPDLDDTAVVFKLLRQAGYEVNPSVFNAFERDNHFMCFPYERNPSMGVHVHLLDALRICPDYEHQPRLVDKTLNFYRTRLRHADWFDKWHASPYYILCHAVIATLGYDNELAREMVNCILRGQRQDGSWGYFGPTSEETAYCLQALLMYHKQVDPVDRAVTYHAAQYLYDHYQLQEYPLLWIDKCLYTPQQIVRSAILSALWMYETL